MADQKTSVQVFDALRVLANRPAPVGKGDAPAEPEVSEPESINPEQDAPARRPAAMLRKLGGDG